MFGIVNWREKQLRLSRMLLTLLGAVALVLASIGIYGVIAFLVGQRAREIGIRLALGATPSGVQRLILGKGLLLGGLGVGIGLGACRDEKTIDSFKITEGVDSGSTRMKRAAERR